MKSSARRGPVSTLRAFLTGEASGGVVLIAAAALDMVVANSAAGSTYEAMLHAVLGPLSVLHWINDGLMALFFLLVGLEIKREFVDGQLASWADRRLPLVAAGCGMGAPALIFLAIAGSSPRLTPGWRFPPRPISRSRSACWRCWASARQPRSSCS